MTTRWLSWRTVIVIFCTVTSATYWKNGRAFSAALAYCVAILGSILVSVLPAHHRVALLFCYWISGAFSLLPTPIHYLSRSESRANYRLACASNFCSHLHRAVRRPSRLGRVHDRGPHEAHDDERHRDDRLCGRKLCGPAVLEEEVSASVRTSGLLRLCLSLVARLAPLFRLLSVSLCLYRFVVPCFILCRRSAGCPTSW